MTNTMKLKRTKKDIELAVEDLEKFGEVYIGNKEIRDVLVLCDEYTRIRKAFEKANPGLTLAFNLETGFAWVI